MRNQMSTEQAALWSKAESMKIGKIYNETTRNSNKSVRDAFKAEKEIAGSFAWAVVKCMGLVSMNYSADECAAISSALDNR